MRILFSFFLFITFSSVVYAQHQEVNETPDVWKKKEVKTDSTSLLSAFRNGSISGHFRYFFMATENKPGLTDYHANAIGGGIKFETARFKNFQIGISGFFIFNIGSSDLRKPDPATGQLNRYEIGLFDIQDPGNKKDINKLEELYLKYNFKKSYIQFGKQLLNTPFINLQDGRMRPTAVEGIRAEINQIKKTKLELAFLYAISPRSTTRWYNPGASLGLYPVGVNENGIKSGYAGNVSSKGIFLTGITHQLTQHLNIQFWNQYNERIINSALLQADYEYTLTGDSKLISGLQVIRQDAVKDGGNADPAKTYVQKGSKAWVWGARAGWKNKKWETTINYTRITAHGKYLMPREWGRDPFFTFLPRERNEGFGDVNAYVLKLGYKIPKVNIKTFLGAGYFDLPEVTNFKLNKYGMPSYFQINADIRYEFTNFLKGTNVQLLYVYKGLTGNSYNNDKFILNKVNMSNFNFVVNFLF
jgi:hypothetical protein